MKTNNNLYPNLTLGKPADEKDLNNQDYGHLAVDGDLLDYLRRRMELPHD